MQEGKREEEATQTILRESRKQKEDKGRESQFSEDLSTLLLSQLCQAALWEPKIKIKDLTMSMVCSP